MLSFVIRRLIGMVAVLFAVSLLVFIVFILIPGVDPAERMAGKNPTPANIQNIREKWGFNKPFYVQYVRMMEKAGNVRDGGGIWQRLGNIAVWNSVMDEDRYLTRRWNEFVSS